MRGGILLSWAGAVLVGCAGPSPSLWPDAVREAAFRGESTPDPGSSPQRERFVPPGVDLDDGLTRDEAVALALWNNAAFAEALASLGLSRAAVAQAATLQNPTASVLFPMGPKQLEFAISLPIDVLWLRPTRLAVAEAEGERTAARLVQAGLDLARDVRAAAIDLEQTRARLQIQEASRNLRMEIAAIAEARLDLGDASELETGTARVDAVEAEQELTRARISAREAEQRFASLLGAWPGTPLPAYVPTPVAETCGGELDALWQEALRARPDFRAAAWAFRAAAARQDLAVAEIFSLSAIYDANGQGSLGFESGPGFTASLPILNQNQGGRERAAAEGEIARTAWIALLQSARLDLALALVRERETSAALRASRRELRPRLESRLEQAQRAYALGDVAYVSVLEANHVLQGAELREVDLGAEHDRACVEIERATGAPLRRQNGTSALQLPGGAP